MTDAHDFDHGRPDAVADHIRPHRQQFVHTVTDRSSSLRISFQRVDSRQESRRHSLRCKRRALRMDVGAGFFELSQRLRRERDFVGFGPCGHAPIMAPRRLSLGAVSIAYARRRRPFGGPPGTKPALHRLARHDAARVEIGQTFGVGRRFGVVDVRRMGFRLHGNKPSTIYSRGGGAAPRTSSLV